MDHWSRFSKLALRAVAFAACAGLMACGDGRAPRAAASAQERTSVGGEACGRSILAGLSLERPLPDAHQMSLAAARVAVGIPVHEPHLAVAGLDTLTNVWVNSRSRSVALVYGRGDVTVMMSPAVYTDPTTNYSLFLRENHASARVGSVRQYVALIISPHTDACRSNLAWVEFDDQGIDTNIASNTHGTATLVTVARSIAADPSTMWGPMLARSSHCQPRGVAALNRRIAPAAVRAAPGSRRSAGTC
jgi:hypothetical protein